MNRILGALDALADLPVTEHAALYLDVHDRLAGTLTSDRHIRGAGADGAP